MTKITDGVREKNSLCTKIYIVLQIMFSMQTSS